MDNVINNTDSDSIQTPEYQYRNPNRQREKVQRPYTDLRDLINQKRQAKDEAKLNEPPSEPKYNFLSDPLRDGDEKTNPDDTERSPPRNNSEYRGRSRGRGRGRGHYQSNNNYRDIYRPNYKKEGEIKGDLGGSETFDEYKSEGSRKNKNTVEEKTYYKTNYRGRQFTPRPNHIQRNFNHGNTLDSTSQQTDELEFGRKYFPRRDEDISGRYKPQRRNEDISDSYKPQRRGEIIPENYRARRNFPARNTQHYRPRSRPNFHFRGHQHRRNPKPLDPVNISVEYSVDSGTRKCTIENKEENNPFNENNQNPPERQKCAEIECEENWDEDEYDNEPRDENEEISETEIVNDKQVLEKNENIEEKQEPNKTKEKINAVEEKQELGTTEENQTNNTEEKQEPNNIEEKQEPKKKEESEANDVKEKQVLNKTADCQANDVEEKQEPNKIEENQANEVKETQEPNTIEESQINNVDKKQELNKTITSEVIVEDGTEKDQIIDMKDNKVEK